MNQRILGIDLGDVRTGFAVSDPTGFLASAVETFTEKDTEKIARRAAEWAEKYACGKIVLGYPKNMNNTVGERGKKSEAFASLLSSLLPACEIVLWDERCTTKSAIDILNTTNTRGKKRKNVIDTVAATLILQSFLDANRNQSL